MSADEVPAYLERRLRDAFDHFLVAEPTNAYASVDEKGWRLSTDPTDRPHDEGAAQLARLKKWLEMHMRTIRLPDLLIEVDNDLGFTRHSMPASRRRAPEPDNIGAHTIPVDRVPHERLGRARLPRGRAAGIGSGRASHSIRRVQGCTSYPCPIRTATASGSSPRSASTT